MSNSDLEITTFLNAGTEPERYIPLLVHRQNELLNTVKELKEEVGSLKAEKYKLINRVEELEECLIENKPMFELLKDLYSLGRVWKWAGIIISWILGAGTALVGMITFFQ